MRKRSSWCRAGACVIVWLASVAQATLLLAQPSDRRFTQELTEGTAYVVAFPQLWVVPTEKPLPTPMQIVITGRTKARVTLTSPGQPDLPAFERTVDVEPGRATRVPVPDSYMSTRAGERVRNAITVRATAPVSVYTTMAWNGGGELARHLPVTAWGKEYRTFNLYQDRFGVGSSVKHRPAQILVIAQQDSTTVTYTPTVTTEAGAHAASVSKGGSGTIVLQQGQTFLIKAEIDPYRSKDLSTDLSGTLIRSDKPIAVVSGHTKGAIMRMPEMMPPSGMFWVDAHFVRNGIHEALLPTSMAGTEFVTVPMLYTIKRVTGNGIPEYGIDDDRGDVIRIVALEDNTDIRCSRQDGTTDVFVRKLRRGEVHTEPVQQFAARWTTSKPALMMQYGKSYARLIPPASLKGEDAVQGHPVVESGMPCMLNVPSVDRWTSTAAFDAPEGLDNFLSVVCKISDASKIVIDGNTPITDIVGGVRPINGTDYGYVRTTIPAGTHIVASTEPNVVFGAWSYGSLDGLTQGRAYGAALTVRLHTACESDSIVIQDVADSATGRVTGTAIVDGDPGCATSVDVALYSSTNYAIVLPRAPMVDQRELPFTLNVIDPTRNAVAIVQVSSPSGKVLERTYTYKGTVSSVHDTDLEHGLVLAPNPVGDILDIRGLDLQATVHIVNMQGESTVLPASSRLDVSALPPGPYMLRVMQGGRVLTARFMVMR
jgi:hypothetical protein